MARAYLFLTLLSLAVLASPAGAQTVDINGGIANPPPDLRTRAATLRTAAVTQSKLARRVDFPGIANPKTSVEDALNCLEKRYKVLFCVNDQAFKDEGVQDVLSRPIGRAIPRMEGVPLSTVVAYILGRTPSRSGITFFPRANEVEISTVRYYRYELFRDGAIVRPTPPYIPKP
jgi:hypothetical protein